MFQSGVQWFHLPKPCRKMHVWASPDLSFPPPWVMRHPPGKRESWKSDLIRKPMLRCFRIHQHLTLLDANFTGATTLDCGVVLSQHSCSVSKEANEIGKGKSPFHCFIVGCTEPIGGRALDQGSSCATLMTTARLGLQGLPVPEPSP